MPVFNCPLCKQTVSQKLYEQITGLWEEKQKQLKDLVKRENELKKKAEADKKKYSDEKKKLTKTHQESLKNQLNLQEKKLNKKLIIQEQKLKKEKEIIEKQFQKKIAQEINKIKKQEAENLKIKKKLLIEKFDKKNTIEINKIKIKLDKEKKKIEADKTNSLAKQFHSLQIKRDKQIKSLEEQLRKNKTAQVLGFENEDEFLKELKSNFPKDEFKHTGKGGDILHTIKDGSKIAGVIVYELKKVQKFNNSYISQTLKAKNDRKADFGILVTNTMPAKDKSGFIITKGIIIINHAGAIILIKLLRQNIIDISRLNLSKKERDENIKIVFEYIQGSGFKNSINTVIQNTIDLYEDMIKEVRDHTRHWQLRYDKYKEINTSAIKIENNILAPLLSKTEKRLLAKDKTTPIALPDEIK